MHDGIHNVQINKFNKNRPYKSASTTRHTKNTNPHARSECEISLNFVCEYIPLQGRFSRHPNGFHYFGMCKWQTKDSQRPCVWDHNKNGRFSMNFRFIAKTTAELHKYPLSLSSKIFYGKREMISVLLWLDVLLLLWIRLNGCDVEKYVWHMKFELI